MLKFNIFNGTVTVPTLARLVLCAAFLTMGWNKLMYTTQFTGADAQLLLDLGVVHAPAGTVRIAPASLRDEQSPEPVMEPAPAPDEPRDPPAEPAPPADDPADEPPVEEPQPEPEPKPDLPVDLPEPPEDLLLTDPETDELVIDAKRLHSVTVAVAGVDWPRPVVLAWIATLTELIGGALLLIGLFSRVWAFGLAIAMGVAFYLTSLPAFVELGGFFGIAADISGGYAAFNRMYVQLGLFVLALGVTLTGPGPLSLDRLLFRPNHPRSPDEPEFDPLID